MTDLAALDAWIAEAQAVLAGMDATDPRHARGCALVAKRKAERETLAWPVARYPFAVRWAREKGWLEIRDIHDGSWIGAMAYTCPDSWRREATAMSRARRYGEETRR